MGKYLEHFHFYYGGEAARRWTASPSSVAAARFSAAVKMLICDCARTLSFASMASLTPGITTAA